MVLRADLLEVHQPPTVREGVEVLAVVVVVEKGKLRMFSQVVAELEQVETTVDSEEEVHLMAMQGTVVVVEVAVTADSAVEGDTHSAGVRQGMVVVPDLLLSAGSVAEVLEQEAPSLSDRGQRSVFKMA